jgi:hypothetical protein
MEIFNNFISPKTQQVFFDFVSSSAFPYRFQDVHNESAGVAQKRYYQSDSVSDSVSDSYEGYDKSYNSTIYATPKQLTHHLFMLDETGEQKSPHYPILTPFLESIYSKVGDFDLLRAKVNVTMPDPRFEAYTSQVPHVDLKYDNGNELPHVVFLYYINDSDGPTYFYNEELEVIGSVPPIMGTCVMFDGGTLHAGSSPNITPFRYALNINIRKK